MTKPYTNGIERRVYDITELRVEDGGDDGPAKISGHAAVFNKLSEPLMGGYRERIRPGAFAKTIREGDVRSLFNHNSDFVLGRTAAKTLELREDKKGLFFEATPPDTQWARDLAVSMKRGDISQASFGFRAVREEWKDAEDDRKQTIRELIEVELFDVSPVTFPAYPQTDAQARAVMEQAGIDWDAITAVLTRSEHGLELREADHETVKTAIDTLTEILTAAPGQEPHPAGADGDEDGQAHVRMLRRRMDLAVVS